MGAEGFGGFEFRGKFGDRKRAAGISSATWAHLSASFSES